MANDQQIDILLGIEGLLNDVMVHLDRQVHNGFYPEGKETAAVRDLAWAYAAYRQAVVVGEAGR